MINPNHVKLGIIIINEVLRLLLKIRDDPIILCESLSLFFNHDPIPTLFAPDFGTFSPKKRSWIASDFSHSRDDLINPNALDGMPRDFLVIC
jgi:hypothetical protein